MADTPATDEAERAELAARQAVVARALLGNGNHPGGFDAGRLAATRASLMSKRARSVARAWPNLAAALGDGFAPRFAAHAASTPLPSEGGPFADGYGFARALLRAGSLSDAVRRDLLAADLRLRPVPGGYAPRRRGFVVRSARLSGPPPRLVVAVRTPAGRERWWSLPLPR